MVSKFLVGVIVVVLSTHQVASEWTDASHATAQTVEVPDAYKNLPRLEGKAQVELETSRGPIVIVVDGGRAPVNAGNFVDLVQKGVYNGAMVDRSEKGYLVQFGISKSPEGYVDPRTGKVRTVPMEIVPEGTTQPVYGKTLKQAGIKESVFPVMRHLPGAVGLAHKGNDPNSGSTQFYITYGNNEMVNPRGNFLDGNNTVFGYVVDGMPNAEKLQPGDKILSAKVTIGAGKLVQP